MPSEYWEWFDEQLKQPERAIGGEPCVLCGNPVPAKGHWKHRDRHVCSGRCNDKLKRQWKRRIARGQAPAFTTTPEDVETASNYALREPRLMKTLAEAPFPYEYDRFPIVGDVLERHGQHTAYLPVADLPYRDTFVEQVMNEAGYPQDQVLAAVHLESGAWTTVFIDSLGMPTRLHLGQVIVGDRMVSSHSPIDFERPHGDHLRIYCNFELFRCIDDVGRDYTWEAISFGPASLQVGLWTPEYAARSEKRKRTTRARSSYLARLRALGVKDVKAERVDPFDIYERDDWTCHICGGLVDRDVEWPDPNVATLDHIEPVSRLGPHDAANIATAHWICNVVKGNS